MQISDIRHRSASRDLQTFAILESSNDDIFATGGHIDFLFDSRVGFSGMQDRLHQIQHGCRPPS